MLFAPSIQDPAVATHYSCCLSGYHSYYKDVRSIHCQYINAHSSHRLDTWLRCAEVQSGTALISFVNTVVVCVRVCMYVCVRPQEANQTTTFMRKQTPLSCSGPSPTLPLESFTLFTYLVTLTISLMSPSFIFVSSPPSFCFLETP